MATMMMTSTTATFDGFDFGSMERELQGRQKVVVSKGTLAKVSREQTAMLKQLIKTVTMHQAAIAKVQEDWAIVDDLQQRVTSLEGQLAEAQETIRQQQETLDKQAEIMEYGKRMDAIQQDLNVMHEDNERRDAAASKQREDHDELATRVRTESTATTKFRQGLQDGRTSISSRAVFVEDDKSALSEVLHTRKSTMKRLDEALFECKETLERKGDADEIEICANEVKNTRMEVVNVKSCLAAVGIDVDGGDGDGVPGGVFVEMANNIKQQKQQLDDTSRTCMELQRSLLDKADVRHVDEKIEHKYQEVVDHLQRAISAAADDEVEFKRVATELQETVKQLMSSKADNQALLEMKEQILNDSRLLDQLSEMRGHLDTKMDRTEAVELISTKPNKRDIIGDVRRQMSQMIAKANFDSGPDAGWATRMSPPPSRAGSRPGTGDAMRGSKSLLCISCNSKLTKPSTADRPMSSPAVSQAAYARNATAQSRDVGAPRHAPTMGPGGPALGGGFHVRLPEQRNARAPARTLPKLQTRSGTGASRIIIGANGIVYQAADAAYLSHPGHGVVSAAGSVDQYTGGAPMAGQPGAALRHAQALPPSAFPDNMPGTRRDSGHHVPDGGGEAFPEGGAGGGAAADASRRGSADGRVEGRPRDLRYAAPATDDPDDGSNGLVRPVSVRTHEPTF